MPSIFSKLAVTASLLLPILAFQACNSDRALTLKVYNWSNYMDEDAIPLFEQWYQAQTGEPVKVIYQTFDICETMLSRIEKGKADYDVVCTSDYIIERMLDKGLLLRQDFGSIPDSINYIREGRSPYFERMFRMIHPEIDANDYAVGHMWTTVGLLYNADYVTDEEASSWNILLNPKFSGKIFIKDAPRVAFMVGLMYLKHREVEEGLLTLDMLSRDSSDGTVAEVEAFLTQAGQLSAGWETDFGKEEIVMERGYVSLNWNGDAVWAMNEAAQTGVHLKYSIPKEGSIASLDGWVIPRYARNVRAAEYFIDFMCRPDIAIRNMDATGYTSASAYPIVLDSRRDCSFAPVDLSYFFPGEDSVCINPALYPDAGEIDKCALLHDWGDDTDKLITMWSGVKGDDAGVSTVIVISTVAVAAILLWVRKRLRMRRMHGRRKIERKHL